MGREIRRVPVDFDAALGKTWHGYVRPDELRLSPCVDCRYGEPCSTGLSPAAYAVHATFYPHQIRSAGGWPGTTEHADRLAWRDKLGQAEVDHLVEHDRLRELRRLEPTEEDPRRHEWVQVPRTAAEVNAANAPGAPMLGDLHHDGINHSLLTQFRCERLGIDMTCPTCQGEGHVTPPEQLAAYEAWEPTEPPTGQGWQLWQTVSEGGPVSPVFATPERLAMWMAYEATGSSRASSPQVALRFIHAGWAPSGVGSAGGFVSGVEAIGAQGEPGE